MEQFQFKNNRIGLFEIDEGAITIFNRAISNPLDSQCWFDTPTWQLLQILFWDRNMTAMSPCIRCTEMLDHLGQRNPS